MSNPWDDPHPRLPLALRRAGAVAVIIAFIAFMYLSIPEAWR